MSVAQKRGRESWEEDGEEQRGACEAALCAAWASAAELRAPAPGKPELEVKLGTMVQGRFVSGFEEAEFCALEKVLCNSFSWIAMPERVATDCMANNSGGGEEMRLAFDSEGALLGAISKRRISNASVPLLASRAMRVSLSVETPVALPPGCAVGMKRAQLDSAVTISLVRRKARRTFLHRSTRGVFQIDMTRVETEGHSGTSFEVELELVQWAIQPHVSEHDRRVWSAALVEFVYQAAQGQISELKFPSFESLYVQKCDERNTPSLLELKKVLLRNFGNLDRGRVERATSIAELKDLPFPGTLPKPLTRSYLRHVDASQFRVSEKTDGTRYFLLAVNPDGKKITHRGVYLVDRNLDFFQVHSEHSILDDFCADFASEGALLLDGEIVQTPFYDNSEHWHVAPGAPVFMVFDVLAYRGFLCDELLAKREQVMMEVTAKFFQKGSTARNRHVISDSRRMVYFPFFLNRKKLFPLADIAQLSKLLHTFPGSGERLYVERDQGRLKRFHKSDGLILTHIGPYAAGVGDFSFKWKYPELISIDFQLIRGNRQIEFHLGGNSKETICIRRDARTCENEAELAAALVKERNAPSNDPYSILDRNREPVIAELAFNRDSGLWIFHRLREKRTPNHVTVGFQTMEQIMEKPIDLIELISIFGRKK